MTAGLTRRAFAGAVLALGACSSRPPEPVPTLAPGTLRIGTYFVNPPFEYVSNDQRIGFEVDLMNEIARRLALTPVFVDTERETILQQMRAGQYDAIVGGITITVMKVYPVAAWLARQTPGLTIVAQVPDDPQPLGIGFANNNPALLAAVNRALADMNADGSYGRLAQKWRVP